MARLPVIIVFGGMLLYAAGMGIFGLVEGLRASRGQDAPLDMKSYYLFVGIGMAVYIAFMVVHNRVLAWLETRLAGPLVHKLGSNPDTRRSALVLGAALLTSGFLMQLVVALLD